MIFLRSGEGDYFFLFGGRTTMAKIYQSLVEQGSGIFKATQESNDISPTIIEIGEVLLLNILNHATSLSLYIQW
jgi:hypothetical protein